MHVNASVRMLIDSTVMR